MHANCPYCGVEGGTRVGLAAGHPVLRCDVCRHAYVGIGNPNQGRQTTTDWGSVLLGAALGALGLLIILSLLRVS